MSSVDTKKDAQACTMDYLLPTGVQDSASSQKNNIEITHDNNSIPQGIDVYNYFPEENNLRIIRLRGYANGNRKYDEAKWSIDKAYTSSEFGQKTKEELLAWEKSLGWLGLVIPHGYEVIDVDDNQEGKLIYNILHAEGLEFHAIKTPNGYQFIFKANQISEGQAADCLTLAGFEVDYRLPMKGYIVLPRGNTEDREWIHIANSELSTTPYYFKRLKHAKERPFTLPISEGGRNDTLFKHLCRLVEFNVNKDEIERVAHFMNKYLITPSMDDREVHKTLSSALKNKPSGNTYNQNEERSVSTNMTDSSGGEKINYKATARMFSEQNEIINNDNVFFYFNQNTGIWRDNADRYFKRQISDFLGDKATPKRASDIFNMMKIDTYEDDSSITYQDMNKNPKAVVFNNGTYYVDKGEFAPKFEPKEYNTVKIDANFNEDIFNNNPVPTATMEFLGNVLDPQEVTFVFEWIGYCMIKGYDIQKFVFLYGDGDNGKSTLINLISLILGQNNVSSVSLNSLQNERFSRVQLYNKLFNSVADISDDFYSSSDFIKALTGDDSIMVEYKGRDGFMMRNFAKLMFSCNKLPSFKDNTNGLNRRVIILPMTKVPKEKRKIESFFNEEERERCIIYSLLSIQQVYENGKQFTISERMQKMQDDWTEENDNVALFLKDCCEFGTQYKTKAQDFYTEYKNYCFDNNYKALGKKNWKERMINNGICPIRTKESTFYMGAKFVGEH
ncbi:TPA: primase C-terminal domain-containing protein [Bacillus cereus]|nr:primase C-terminal domain-containing protein [Bacillus cereus]